MIIFRPHRETLAEAMGEAKEFESVAAMKNYIVQLFTTRWGRRLFEAEDIVIEGDAVRDDRNGWKDTRYVCIKRMGDDDYILIEAMREQEAADTPSDPPAKKKRLFISQPMRGKTVEEITAARGKAVRTAKKFLGENVEVINSIRPDAESRHPLDCLADSLRLLATADVAFFAEGWNRARGCMIEHQCATEYGIIALDDLRFVRQPSEYRLDTLALKAAIHNIETRPAGAIFVPRGEEGDPGIIGYDEAAKRLREMVKRREQRDEG